MAKPAKSSNKRKLLGKANLKRSIHTTNWHFQLQQSSKGKNYMAFNDTVSFETYFNKLLRSQYLKIYKMRMTNHRLPIEMGRRHGIELQERKCTLCEKKKRLS